MMQKKPCQISSGWLLPQSPYMLWLDLILILANNSCSNPVMYVILAQMIFLWCVTYVVNVHIPNVTSWTNPLKAFGIVKIVYRTQHVENTEILQQTYILCTILYIIVILLTQLQIRNVLNVRADFCVLPSMERYRLKDHQDGERFPQSLRDG